MEARVHQERIGPIDEHGGTCQRAVERKHPLTRLVDPASARCLGVRVAGEVDEFGLGQLGTDALDELAVAKLKTQSQRVVSQICSPQALRASAPDSPCHPVGRSRLPARSGDPDSVR